MISRLSKCAGYEADSPAPKFPQRPKAAFIAIIDPIDKTGTVSENTLLYPSYKPLHPAWFCIQCAKYVMGAFVAFIEFGTHQHAISKCKSSQMVLDDTQIFIVKLLGKH